MRMQRPLSAIGFGILAWLIPFAVGMALFPIWENDRVLFESLISVVLTAATVLALWLYVRRLTSFTVRDGVLLGILWIVIAVLLDLPFFLFGPAQMSPLTYVREIGVAYLSILVLTAGFGAIRKR